MNHLIIIGRVGLDATVNSINGKQVVNFNVAVSEKWKDADKNVKEKTTWFNCAFWNDGRVYEFIKKGNEISVVGKVDCKLYDAKDGTKKAVLSIDVLNVELLGSKKD